MAATRKKSQLLSEAVGKALARHLPSGARLRVAFSGGLDSMVLLHVLARSGADYALSAMHVHHGLSRHADAWADFCLGACNRLKVPLETVQVEVERDAREGVEASARLARYAALMRSDVDAIATAHHADDQAETILFQLLRGGGPRALAAMPEARRLENGMLLVRPLLGFARRDLETYAHENGLHWVEDESNADPRFTRNALRHDVMPVIAKHILDYRERLNAAAQRMAETVELLDALAILDGGAAGLPDTLDVDSLNTLPEIRARNLLAHFLRQHGVALPTPAHLGEMLRQIREAKTRLSLKLGDGRVLNRVGRRLKIVPSGLE